MSQPAWTPVRMLERLEGDESLARELVGLFLVEYGRLMRALEAAADAGHAERVRAAAHALKGCIGNFTDEGPYLLASDIERQSAGGEPLRELPGLLRRLDSELEAMAARMRSFETGA